jgi:recombination protein RecT
MAEQKKELTKNVPGPTGAQTEKDDIRSLIQSDAGKKQFALALPKHLKPDRFVRIALTAFTKNPKLLQCTKESLLSCLLDLSQMGLEPDGRKAHLIPYNNKKTGQVICTLIVDYKGLVDIARRSGEIADIHADVVCENDKFEYNFGTDSKLVHVPAIKTRGKVTASYSFVRLKDGSSSFEVMNVDEVEKIRTRSWAAHEGPWVTDWNEMAKKTIFRRHSKWLPDSPEMQIALEKDWDKPADMFAIPGEAPMIGLRNDKRNKSQPAIETQAHAVTGAEKTGDLQPGKEFKPSPSDPTKTSENDMKREIMIMLRDIIGENEKAVEDALVAYTTYVGTNQVRVIGIRDVNDQLFNGDWIIKTHEKLAKAYLEKIGG